MDGTDRILGGNLLRSLREAPLSVGGTVGAIAIITDLGLRILFQKPLGTSGVVLRGSFFLLCWLGRKNHTSWQDLVQTSLLVQWLRGRSYRQVASVQQVQKQRTARIYGHLWSMGHFPSSRTDGHYREVQPLLPPGHLVGRILDAGCGQGGDAWQMAKESGGRVVAVDIALDGLLPLSRRPLQGPFPLPLQADLERLPLKGTSFDFVYSYGVLHHLPNPRVGVRELIRVLKPGGLLALYVYEDFSTRTWAERMLLKAVGVLRKVTTRMPPPLLYRLCQGISPFIFLACTMPYRLLRRFPCGRPLAERIPYRHGESPWSLGPDLYDRFAAPIENRYSKEVLESWLREESLTGIQVVPHRGWVAFGVKR